MAIPLKDWDIDKSIARRRSLQTIDESNWNSLIERIREGRCTPFLGAGVNDSSILPLGKTIAETWAKENNYPLQDPTDLARVAQYLAITRVDAMDCKEELLRKWFRKVQMPAFGASDSTLGLLAQLPLPVYMTTNYDPQMVNALKSFGKKPHREVCRWNNHPSLKNRPSVWDRNRGFRPTKDSPLVYHLHGIDEIYESLVLTEDDYVDFLVNISRRQDKLLPPFIQETFAATSLMFIGYRMNDWTFRVLFRGLVSAVESGLRRTSIAVQLPPEMQEPQRLNVQKYLNSYYNNMRTLVYWGTADEFTSELRARCKDAKILA